MGINTTINLSGKVALITGGARGIGRSCALALGAVGATVAINYNRSAEKAAEVQAEINRGGGKAELFRADVSKPDDVSIMFGQIRERFKRLDILVNNAGIIRDMLLLAMELPDWDKVYEVNLRGAFLCTRLAAEMMMTSHSGRIINIASIGAIRGGRGQTNYAAAKGGLLAFTRACAVELAGKGIRVNAVLPGMIDTEMSRRVLKRAGEKILESVPTGRLGTPEDVAALVVFLASDQADYITGQAIAVDGGLSVS